MLGISLNSIWLSGDGTLQGIEARCAEYDTRILGDLEFFEALMGLPVRRADKNGEIECLSVFDDVFQCQQIGGREKGHIQ